jgi:hypothetical protein
MAAKKSTAGRVQRKTTAAAEVRKPNLAKYYGRKLSSIEGGGGFDFSLDVLGGGSAKGWSLDPHTTSFEWVDDESTMTGSLSLQRPDLDTWKSLPIGRGHTVRCRVKWGGRMYTLWTMRADPPEVNARTGEVQVALNDDMALVRLGKRRWLYRKTKRRKTGYFGHEVLRLAARKAGVRVGSLVRCGEREAKWDVTGSFLDLAKKVYENEAKKTGKQYVVRMRNGRFEVVEYKRNAVLYVIDEQLREASITEEPKVKAPVTVWTGTGRVGKGKDAKKVSVTVKKDEMVRRFGFTQKTKSYGRVDSRAALRKLVVEDLAEQYEVNRKAQIQFGGIPFIRRGDGVQVVVRSDRLVGEDSFMYATAVRHQVQSGSYNTDADVTQVDPFHAAEEKAAKAAREKARARKKKKATKK